MKPQTKFKQTEIGMIPEDWDVKRIGDIVKINEASINKNFAPEKIEYIDIDSVNQGHIENPQELNLNEAPSRAKRIVRDNDIIISTVRPNLKHFAIIKKAKPNTIVSTGFAVITSKKIDSHFLYYYLTTDKYINFLTAIADAHTSTYPSFNPDIIENSVCPYPNENEQQSIASILSSLDSKIELNQQMNKTLEAIGQALFKHWFVDFEFPNEEGKPYKSSGGEIEDSELGEIPKWWRVGTLGDYVDVVKGCSYRSEDLRDSDKALVTLKSIERGGGFKSEGLKPYVGEYKQEQIILPGELVVAHTDLTQKAEVLGKPAIVRKVSSHSTLIASLDLTIVRPKNNSTNIPFVYFLLKTEDFQNHAYGYAGGTTVLHLNKRAIPDYRFILPQKDLVKKFGDILIKLLNKIQNNEIESEVLSFIRDSLLPKLMSGRIRVPLEVRA